MFHARARPHTHTHTHTHTHMQFCMYLQSDCRRIFKCPFPIMANPYTKHKFPLTVTLLVKSQVKVTFWGFAPCSVFLCFLRRVGGKYCLLLQDSGYRSNEVEENASHQNHLSHPKMQAILPSKTSDETKHSVVWCKSHKHTSFEKNYLDLQRCVFKGAQYSSAIDHVLMDRRWHSTILDVQSLRGADCDTDHCLAVGKSGKFWR